MTRSRAPGLILLSAAWCAVAGVQARADIGPVSTRDGRVIAPDQIQAVTDQGVVLRPALGEDGTPRALLVPWIGVEQVGPAGAASWGEAERFRPVADALMRAELRLSRGDVPGTVALLGPLTERYLNETGRGVAPSAGPTTGLIASAMTICRVLRDDSPGAARAWLIWRETREGPDRAWIDQSTGIAPALPPVWASRDASAFLAGSSFPATLVSGDRSEYAAELARLYTMAARSAAGEPMPAEPEAPPTRLRADAGVRLAWEMVRAQVDPELSGRREARDALRRRLRSGSPAWEEAWAHLGIGASLLREPDPLDADAGAAELIGVVISHRDAAPGLAGLALTLATEYFEQTGRPGHAEAARAMDRAAGRRFLSGPAADEPADNTADPADDPVEEFP